MRDNKTYFKRVQIQPSEVVHVTEELSNEDLDRFFNELTRINFSDNNRSTFFALAELPAKMRLVINLNRFISKYKEPTTNVIHSVVSDGLHEFEGAALFELANKDADVETNAVAHSLLNIEERHSLLEAMNAMFSGFQFKKGQDNVGNGKGSS